MLRSSYSGRREFDHMPELIPNHSNPGCSLLQPASACRGNRSDGNAHTHRASSRVNGHVGAHLDPRRHHSLSKSHAQFVSTKTWGSGVQTGLVVVMSGVGAAPSEGIHVELLSIFSPLPGQLLAARPLIDGTKTYNNLVVRNIIMLPQNHNSPLTLRGCERKRTPWSAALSRPKAAARLGVSSPAHDGHRHTHI